MDLNIHFHRRSNVTSRFLIEVEGSISNPPIFNLTSVTRLSCLGEEIWTNSVFVSYPTKQNWVVAIFFSCKYGWHFEFKMADLYRDQKINLLQSCLKACNLVHLIGVNWVFDSLVYIGHFEIQNGSHICKRKNGDNSKALR